MSEQTTDRDKLRERLIENFATAMEHARKCERDGHNFGWTPSHYAADSLDLLAPHLANEGAREAAVLEELDRIQSLAGSITGDQNRLAVADIQMRAKSLRTARTPEHGEGGLLSAAKELIHELNRPIGSNAEGEAHYGTVQACIDELIIEIRRAEHGREGDE